MEKPSSSSSRRPRGKGRKGKEEKDNDPTKRFKSRFRLTKAASQSRRPDQDQEGRVASSSRLTSSHPLSSPIAQHQSVNVPNAFTGDIHANPGALVGTNNDPTVNWSLNSNHLDCPPSERGCLAPTDFGGDRIGGNGQPDTTHGTQGPGQLMPTISGSTLQNPFDPAILPQRTHHRSPNIIPPSTFYNAEGQGIHLETLINQPNVNTAPYPRQTNVTLPNATPGHNIREQMLPNLPPYAREHNPPLATIPFIAQEGNHTDLPLFTRERYPSWPSTTPPILDFNNEARSNYIPRGHYFPAPPPIPPPFSGYGGVPDFPATMPESIPSSWAPASHSHSRVDHLHTSVTPCNAESSMYHEPPLSSTHFDLTTSPTSDITPRPPMGRSFHHPPVGWTPNSEGIQEGWRVVQCQCGTEIQVPVHIHQPRCHRCGRFVNWA